MRKQAFTLLLLGVALCCIGARATCPTNFPEEIEGFCFYSSQPSDIRKNRCAAHEYCSSINGTLIRSLASFNKFANYLIAKNLQNVFVTTETYHIGMSDLLEESGTSGASSRTKFRWLDGTLIDQETQNKFYNLEPNGGTQDCIATKRQDQTKLRDLRCSDSVYFACEPKPAPVSHERMAFHLQQKKTDAEDLNSQWADVCSVNLVKSTENLCALACFYHQDCVSFYFKPPGGTTTNCYLILYQDATIHQDVETDAAFLKYAKREF